MDGFLKRCPEFPWRTKSFCKDTNRQKKYKQDLEMNKRINPCNTSTDQLYSILKFQVEEPLQGKQYYLVNDSNHECTLITEIYPT